MFACQSCRRVFLNMLKCRPSPQSVHANYSPLHSSAKSETFLSLMSSTTPIWTTKQQCLTSRLVLISNNNNGLNWCRQNVLNMQQCGYKTPASLEKKKRQRKLKKIKEFTVKSKATRAALKAADNDSIVDDHGYEIPDPDDLVTSPEEQRAKLLHQIETRLAKNSGRQHLKSAFAKHIPRMKQLIELMESQGFSSSNMLQAISIEQVLESPVKSVEDLIAYLKINNFTTGQISAILECYPAALKPSGKASIDVTMVTLRAIGCKDKNVPGLIYRNPAILKESPQSMSHRYSQLVELFPKAKTLSLIYRIPYVLTCPWKEIKRKYQYVLEEMGVQDIVIASTDLLSHPMRHIITRHTFLHRAGLYERPNKHGSTRIPNPPLDLIMDTDDSYFACTVAGMSLQEYTCFWKILEMEEELLLDEEIEEVFLDDEDLFGDNKTDQVTDPVKSNMS